MFHTTYYYLVLVVLLLYFQRKIIYSIVMVNENVEEWITIEENLFWRKKPQKQQCFGSENLWKTFTLSTSRWITLIR